MTTGEAAGKVCPFMTKPVHEPSGLEYTPGITTTAYVYCMNTLCMSWEPSMDGHGIIDMAHGYCKLMEKDQNEPLY